MAKRKPSHSDSDIVSPWLGAMPTVTGKTSDNTQPTPGGDGYDDNTTFRDNRDGTGYDKSGRPGGSRFVKTTPVYPRPQFIGDMPMQFAGYTDYPRKEEFRNEGKFYGDDHFDYSAKPINRQGQIAVGASHYPLDGSAQDFLNTKSVFVNPLFKAPYDKIGNDPDSSDRSRGPLIVPRERQATLRAMSKGVNQWAKETSAYFNKPFVVGKSPVFDRKGAPLTTQVNIYGEEAQLQYAGIVYGSGSRAPWLENKESVKKEKKVKPATPLYKTVTLNTDLTVDGSTFVGGMKEANWANTSQHEFGHTMGFGHPHEYARGTTLNSEMSYDAKDVGARMLPATINAWKQLINKNYGYTGIAKLRAEEKKQEAAYAKLQKLNRKY